jgi:hypothetical protein
VGGRRKMMITEKLGKKIGDMSIQIAKLETESETMANELEEFYLMYDILSNHLKREGDTVMCLIDGSDAKVISNFFKLGDNTL